MRVIYFLFFSDFVNGMFFCLFIVCALLGAIFNLLQLL